MSASPRPQRVRCPECGEFFSRRGLAGHRRFKHGQPAQASVPSTREEVAVELERQQAALPGGDATKAQAHFLAEIVDLLKGMDARLERIEACALTSGLARDLHPETSDEVEADGAAVSGEGNREEAKRLSRDLQEVLRSIAALRAERQKSDGDQSTEEIDRKLGRLRMRQAGLLFRLGKDAPGAPPESEGAFDWF